MKDEVTIRRKRRAQTWSFVTTFVASAVKELTKINQRGILREVGLDDESAESEVKHH